MSSIEVHEDKTLKHLSYMERTTELDYLASGRAQGRRDLTGESKQLMRGCKVDETTLFSVRVPSKRTRSSGLKQKYRTYHINLRLNLLNASMIEHWNRLPGGKLRSSLRSPHPWRYSKPDWTTP